MSLTSEEIRAAISASATLRDLVPDTTAIAAALSDGRTKIVSLMINERGILDKYPEGPLLADGLLTRVEAVAASASPLASIVARAIRFLRQPEGIDLGAPATQAMLDALQQAGTISAQELTHLRSMVTAPNPVAEMDVRRALWTDNGKLRI